MTSVDAPSAPERVADVFGRAHGAPPAGVWAAPGRVNLMGEHTDYNDGFVLPFALPMCCYAAASLRADGMVTMRSLQASGAVSADVSARPGEVSGWAAHVQGVVWALRSQGYAVPGLDVVVDSDVPLGAGLSSSAAIECAVALALNDLLSLELTAVELAAVGRHAENDFVGAPTGVMDQAVSMLATADHLLFLDTRSMAVEQVPLALAPHHVALVVIDTRAPHRNVTGEYGARRASCQEAVRRLGVPALRDIDAATLSEAAARVDDPTIGRRLRHVVTENARVLSVVDSLRDASDPRAIGPTMTASHASMRDDFEISCPELDLAVDTALGSGAHGARMTGGGFGGCTVSLVDADRADDVGRAVTAAFAAAGFAAPTCFTTAPSAGARRVR
jgi:galactokinase